MNLAFASRIAQITTFQKRTQVAIIEYIYSSGILFISLSQSTPNHAPRIFISTNLDEVITIVIFQYSYCKRVEEGRGHTREVFAYIIVDLNGHAR